MTTTDKPVQRVTRGKFNVLFASSMKARAIVTRIGLGDVLYFREQGRREWFPLNIETAFKRAVANKAFRDAIENAELKKAGLKPRKRKGRR